MDETTKGEFADIVASPEKIEAKIQELHTKILYLRRLKRAAELLRSESATEAETTEAE